MQSNQTFCFHGVVTVRVLYGSIDVFAYTLTDSQPLKQHTLYAPFCSNSLTLHAGSDHRSSVDIQDVLSSLPDTDCAIVNTLKDHVPLTPTSTVIVLSTATPPDHSSLYAVKATSIDDIHADIIDTYNISGVYPLFTPKLATQPLVVASHWMAFIADRILPDKAPVIMTLGTKDIGKSTFNRILVNRLLGKHSQVLHLETDVGQTEFTPHGLVSLTLVSEPIFGPTWSHIRTPIKSYFFGDTSPKNDPERYLALVRSIITQARAIQRAYGVPIVVNTMGWLKGIGYFLAEEMIKCLAPSHIVYLYSPRMASAVNDIAFTQHSVDSLFQGSTNSTDVKSTLYTIQGVQYSGSTHYKIGAAKIRDLCLKSYLTCSIPLVQQKPYGVKFTNLKIAILSNDVPHDQTMYALNAGIIGLCNDSLINYNTVNVCYRSLSPPAV
eukprot:gene4970-5781_t